MASSASAPYRVLIAAYTDSDVACEIPYLFRKAGCRVDIFCAEQAGLRRGSYWDRWLEPSGRDAAAFAHDLDMHTRADTYDWVVLADDAAVRVMNAALASESGESGILPIVKRENRALLGSKSGLSLLCERHGIQTPRFGIYQDGEPFPVRVPFPLLLKVDESGGGEGVYYCADQASVKTILACLVPEIAAGALVQEYVDGEIIAVEALYKAGRLIAYVASEVVGTFDSAFSPSRERRYTARTEIEPDLERAGQALGFDGFATMTYMRDLSGRYLLIEADLRPQAWFRIAARCGLDFSRAIRAYLEDSTDILRPSLPGDGVRAWHFARELEHQLRRERVVEVLKWCANVGGRWGFLPAYDLPLFLGVLRDMATRHAYRFYVRMMPTRTT